jgi:hypothetical protein
MGDQPVAGPLCLHRHGSHHPTYFRKICLVDLSEARRPSPACQQQAINRVGLLFTAGGGGGACRQFSHIGCNRNPLVSAAWGRVVMSVTSCPNPNTAPLLAVYTIFAVPLLTATRPLQRPLKGTCATWRPAACPVKHRRGSNAIHLYSAAAQFHSQQGHRSFIHFPQSLPENFSS